MRVLRPLGIIATLLLPIAIAQGQINSYNANFTSTAPTIDGTLSAGEWDIADTVGDWTLLRTPNGGDPNAEDSRFQAMWDQSGIYFSFQTDYGNWAIDFNGQNPAASDFVGDFFNVFLDPNTLGEANGQLDAEIDNYQVGFNLYDGGPRSCGLDGVAGTADDCSQHDGAPDAVAVNGSAFGALTAAHVDGLFNNASEWEHLRLTQVAYDFDSTGGELEMFMPWSEFDAPEVTPDPMNPVETGLHHPFAPEDGDVWLFNVTRQSSDPDNFLPVWQWTDSLFFASHGDGAPGQGHGELIFVGGGGGVDADFNGDGNFDCADVDSLVAAIAGQTGDLSFDLNGDSVLDGADLTQWLADAGAENLASGNSYLVGDFNLDGSSDVTDFNIWNANKFTNTAAFCSGDANADGVIDTSDFNAWNTTKFTSSDSTHAVPEPASGLLLLVATFGLGLMRRSRRS